MDTSLDSPRIKIRPALERGHVDHGWLDSYHTFSFADYYDPNHVGFRSLRVINEDRVEPAAGFGSHPHRDMEILSYVVSGTLRHKDSMGNESDIKAGEVQKISAGTGITHSEFNASVSEPVHFLQIWIKPATKGLTPTYQDLTLPQADDNRPLFLIASPEGGKAAIHFNQDVLAFRGILKAGRSLSYDIKPGRACWLQMIKGEIDLDNVLLDAGDGASVEHKSQITISAKEDSEFLLFDLA